ncbi:hypothetical protein RF11_03477 [Thelohanellus kitauei]|uniref:Uncharacterized protein n=1 Tax=Thelohanellus kitauei TaxID=669202 RepID=A0A0C2J0W0_THEKT|nr:hypothetical protein RF11_03477 [Thelohanellus kitauei]
MKSELAPNLFSVEFLDMFLTETSFFVLDTRLPGDLRIEYFMNSLLILDDTQLQVVLPIVEELSDVNYIDFNSNIVAVLPVTLSLIIVVLEQQITFLQLKEMEIVREFNICDILALDDKIISACFLSNTRGRSDLFLQLNNAILVIDIDANDIKNFREDAIAKRSQILHNYRLVGVSQFMTTKSLVMAALKSGNLSDVFLFRTEPGVNYRCHSVINLDKAYIGNGSLKIFLMSPSEEFCAWQYESGKIYIAYFVGLSSTLELGDYVDFKFYVSRYLANPIILMTHERVKILKLPCLTTIFDLEVDNSVIFQFTEEYFESRSLILGCKLSSPDSDKFKIIHVKEQKPNQRLDVFIKEKQFEKAIIFSKKHSLCTKSIFHQYFEYILENGYLLSSDNFLSLDNFPLLLEICSCLKPDKRFIECFAKSDIPDVYQCIKVCETIVKNRKDLKPDFLRYVDSISEFLNFCHLILLISTPSTASSANLIRIFKNWAFFSQKDVLLVYQELQNNCMDELIVVVFKYVSYTLDERDFSQVTDYIHILFNLHECHKISVNSLFDVVKNDVFDWVLYHIEVVKPHESAVTCVYNVLTALASRVLKHTVILGLNLDLAGVKSVFDYLNWFVTVLLFENDLPLCCGDKGQDFQKIWIYQHLYTPFLFAESFFSTASAYYWNLQYLINPTDENLYCCENLFGSFGNTQRIV